MLTKYVSSIELPNPLAYFLKVSLILLEASKVNGTELRLPVDPAKVP